MKKWCGIAAAAAVLAVGAGQVAQAADDYKSFGVRVRAIYVKPDESTGGLLSTLNTKVSDDIIPELDLEYFFTKNFSTELIAGVTRHDIKVAGLGGFAGSTWLLPPTLTLKYHPLAGSTFSPYVGFGLNVVFPFNSKVNGVNDFQIDNSIGWAAQAGTDIKITDSIYFNIDYKYLNVDTEATVLGTKCKLDLNPHLVGIGVGYRF
ncbi:MAG: outer membrane beta-barrel protein [Geobacteraceae bacterium]|nr:outer membrane beta-barrel protein [Geobacteraceae bacterium]